jgi:2-hydroxy-3-oxopropionate reductase
MERIGFIGLGAMGKPMSRNLLKAGHALTVHNRSRGAVDELVGQGATAADSPADVAAAVDVIITMLPDSPDVEAVVFGERGLLGAVRGGMLLIDMSTIAPATARRVDAAFRERDAHALDAPVSGGVIGAEQGTLSVMVGGAESAFERALPLLESLGKYIVRIGEAGAGQVAKACNQIVVAQTIQAVAEALTLARKCGVDPAKVRDALLGGFAQSRILDVHGKRMLDRTFDPGFRIELHRKDLGIALQTGRETGVALPATAIVAEQMNALIAQGDARRDHSALALLVERLAGL